MLIVLGFGLAVGVILALTGTGGDILAVPLLVFGIGMGVAQASPIGLLAVGMAAALGAGLGLREGIVGYRAAMLIAASGMLLSPLSLWLAHRLDNRWLSVLFAMILLLVAFRTFHQATRSKMVDTVNIPALHPCQRDAGTGRFIWTSSSVRALALSGTVAGLLSGLLDVGGGFVMVPSLLHYIDLKMRSVVATSLAVSALVSVTGVVTSASTGGMVWNIAMPFSAGALVGMLGARTVSARLAGPHLQIGFAMVSGAVAIGMIVKSVF